MLDLVNPKPLTGIIDDVAAKTPIGSVLRTAGWEAVPQGLRDQAFFSAGVTSAQFLATQQQAVRDLIARAKGVNEKGEPFWKMDRSRFISEMRQLGEALNIQRPGGRADGMVREGDLADPVSIARLRLVINTQLEMAYGYADWLTGMDPDILEAYPAWELVRISPRRVPRDWETRWAEAAIAVGWEGVYREPGSTRLIALKTSPIWVKLSRFGKPHPPFDFNSGMGVEEIDRAGAEELGLLDSDTVLIPALRPHQLDLEASVKGLGAQQKALLQETFGSQIQTKEDVVRWTGQKRRGSPQPLSTVTTPAKALAIDATVNDTMATAARAMTQAAEGLLAPMRSGKPLPVSGTDAPRHGFYYDSGTGKPVQMLLGQDTGTPHLEAAHELGHYWAFTNLTRGQADQRAPVDFTLAAEDWLREVMETEPVKMLQRALTDAKTTPEKEALSYLLQPGELWARSFAEWLAVRSGQADAMRELSRVVNGQVPGQADWLYWGNADLVKLLPLLDDLLR